MLAFAAMSPQLAAGKEPVCVPYLCKERQAERTALLLRLTNRGEALPKLWQGVACLALLALDHARKGDGSVIPELAGLNSSIEHVLLDTRSDPASGVTAYRAARANGASSIVGAARSAVSVPLGYVETEDVMPAVSYWSSTPALSDQKLFPLLKNFFLLCEMPIPCCKKIFWSAEPQKSFYFREGSVYVLC